MEGAIQQNHDNSLLEPNLLDSKDYRFRNVPEELKNIPQWVCWKFENREGKVKKAPVNVNTGRKAYTNKSETWATFSEVLEYFQSNRPEVGGIGFVFTRKDPFAGIDLDACRDPETGKIEDWAMEIIQRFNSYTEISPRGRGVHILVKGELPPGGNRKGTIEMYDSGQYFTVTGKHLQGTPLEVKERDAELKALHGQTFNPLVKPSKDKHNSPQCPVLSDKELLQRASQARNGAKFLSLWQGDISDYDNDHSQADLGLCGLLAFYCGNDSTRIDRLFRQSGLMRDKWNEVHFADGKTYGQATIELAIQNALGTYSGTTQGQPMPLREQPANSPSEKPKYHLTEVGNAKKFVAIHGKKVRYCADWNSWFIWEGKRWAKDKTHRIMEFAKETVRAMYSEASQEGDENRRKELVSHALKCETSGKLTSMVSLARSESGIPICPEEFDRDKWFLNCLNGTIDLRTGELMPHQKEHHLTKLAPVNFDPEAPCEQWLGFLNKIMDSDESTIDFVQKAIGYSLTGDTREQCLFILWGVGANGKSTLLKVIGDLLGDYSKQANPEAFLTKRPGAIPHDLAALKGSRFVTGVEVENERQLAEALIKQLTGGDTITARFLFSEFFEFDPTFKIFLATNHKPFIKGNDHAIWRRIRLIPFTVKIPEHEQIKDFPEMLKVEWPGILSWAVQGCIKWQKEGLGYPERVKNATQEYREEMDILGDFLSECCVESTNAKTPAKDLYQAYLKHAEVSGERQPLGKTAFGIALTERGFRRGKGSKGVWTRYGIGLRVE